MNTVFLVIILIGALFILGVVAYNIYQETQYRKKIYEQFGHSDKDVLIEDPALQVRDGDNVSEKKIVQEKNTVYRSDKNNKKDQHIDFSLHLSSMKNTIVQKVKDKTSVDSLTKFSKTSLFQKESIDESLEEKQSEIEVLGNSEDDLIIQPKIIDANATKESIVSVESRLLLSLQDLEQLDLPWFHKYFDYMTYISLREPKELHVLPRLSGKHRFRIAGCTLDGLFQLAEPIPGVKYQGFLIGFQAISRSGLVSEQDLNQFGKNVGEFATGLGGKVKLTDVKGFLELAKPMDELCARVDQIIALHLVSRDLINGIELRAILEKFKFELSHDGAFYYPNITEPMYRIVSMDDTPFTSTLLSTKTFKGFSMLFDIAHVPTGSKNFDTFMELAVKLASELSLDLVDDQFEELSTQWLRNIGHYVEDRQKEMEAVGIVPGEDLANRLFA